MSWRRHISKAGHRRRATRGFTLLETMLAAAIGLVVVMAVFGILDSLTRTERVVERHVAESEELARLHRVMSRAFSSLAMSEVPPPPMQSLRERQNGARRNEEAAASSTSSTAGSASAAAAPADAVSARALQSLQARGMDAASAQAALSAARTQSGSGAVNRQRTTAEIDAAESRIDSEKLREQRRARPPSRVTLTSDSSARSELAALPTRQNQLESPQRLEVVLAESPVPLPPEVATAARGARGAQGAREVHAHRGVFELLPEVDEQADESRPQSWALWWRPLPPAVNAKALESSQQVDESVIVPGSDLPPPVKVAGSIATLQWRAFHENNKKTDYSAAWAQELPGYFELEVRTVGGRYANWMFEVSWSVMREVDEAPVAAGADEAEEEGRDPSAASGTPSGSAPGSTSGAPRGGAEPAATGNGSRARTPRLPSGSRSGGGER